MPDEPERDSITDSLLELFYLADRGRRFVECVAMPLSVPEIRDCIDVLGLDLSDREIYNTLFELDRMRLEELRKK